MHPELINHPYFMRYYRRWQEAPTSSAFVGVADLLCAHAHYDDAIKVCREGLTHNPDLISGRLILARCLVARGESEAAREVLGEILALVPGHVEALRLQQHVQPQLVTPVMTSPAGTPTSNPWATMTMARLYLMQGLRQEAREVFQAILVRDPQHAEARRGLTALEHEGA